jgi:hypothetical protein
MDLSTSEIIHQEMPPLSLNLIAKPKIFRELTGLYPDVKGLALSLAPRVYVVGTAIKKYDSLCDDHWYIIDLTALNEHRKMLHEFVNACYVELDHCQQLLAIDRLAKYDPIYKSYYKKTIFLTGKLLEAINIHKETLCEHIRLEVVTTPGVESIKIDSGDKTLAEFLTEIIDKLKTRSFNFKLRLLTGRRDDIIFLDDLLSKLRSLQLVLSSFYTCEDDFATSRVAFPSPHSNPYPDDNSNCCTIC